MHANGRGTAAYSVKERASDNKSKLIHHPPHHLQQQQQQQRASYLGSGSYYSFGDLGLVDGIRRSPDINPLSGAHVGLSPAWDPLGVDVAIPRRSLPSPRARRRRPGSVDTDSSSADSGPQTAGPTSQGAAGGATARTRQDYYKEICRVVYEQRMPIVQDGYVATGGSCCSSSSNGVHHPSPGSSRVVVDGRLRGLPDRGVENPQGRNSYTECGSVGQWGNGVNRGINGYGLMCASRNGLSPPQNGFFNQEEFCTSRQEPIRVAVPNGPAFLLNGVAMVRSGPQHEQHVRDDYLRRRSNSNDSGYHDRNAEALLERSLLHAQGLPYPQGPQSSSDRCLEAHQLSLSAPSTPVHSSPKKSSTPSMIRRQFLKTISEAVMTPLLRPKLAKERPTQTGNQSTESRDQDFINVNTSRSDVSDDDEETGNAGSNWKGSRRSQAQSLDPPPSPPFLQNSSVGRPANGGLSSSGGAVDSSAPKKPKSLASRTKFWSKKVGELKSAPSSPEPSRKNARLTQGPLMDGHITVKTPTNILQLTDGERLALQKIALQRLQQLGLGQISIPKSGYERRRSLKGIFQLKRHGTASNGAQTVSAETTAKGGGTGVALGEPEKEKSSTRSRRWTFGIHLESCINNDSILGRVTLNQPPDGSRRSKTDEGVAAEGGGRLLDALSLSVNHGLQGAGGGAGGGPDDGQTLHVPYVVRTCCSHLKGHALRVKGLFRIGGLKSRVIQLKQEFDSGAKVHLTADHSPHDVASLLKEFLRELPHCLLTRDLFQAFVATASLKNFDERLMALRLLVALLPVANRDTLWMLLSLLRSVVENSSDRVTRNGAQLPGNCMDSSNLATLFGPNLLHKHKPGKSHVDSMDQLTQHLEVIAVVKEMINSFEAIFKLPEDIHREILDALMEQNPEAAEYILCHQDNGTCNQGNGACPRVPSDSALRLLDDSRENSFLTNSNSSTVSSDVPTDQPRLRELIPQVVTLQCPPLQEKQNLLRNRTSLNHSSSSQHSFQKTDGISFDRSNGKSPSAGNCPDPDLRELQQGRGLTSTPKSNGHVVSRSRTSLSPAFMTGATTRGKNQTENMLQHVMAARFGPSSPLGPPPPEMEGQSGAGSWEQQRWKYWEELAKKDSEELHEQQTLV